MADTELRPARRHRFLRWRVRFLLALLLIAAFAPTTAVKASNQWFVSTSGSPSGDGSSTNPWDLNTALNQPAVVQPGDTIWLRGGVYHAPTTNGYSSILNGTAANPIIVRNYNNERAIIDGHTDEFSLAVRGSYSWFWGLEIMDSNTNRVPDSCDAILGYEPHPSAFGVGVYGPSNKFINLVVHDTAQGFSAYDESPDTEFTGNLSYYNGNLPYPSCPGGDRNHGHGMYLQNVTGLKTVNDNIIGDNADEGIQMYGGGGANVEGFRLNGNALYNSSSWPDQNFQFNVLIAGGAVRKDIQFNNNFSYFTPSRDFGVVSFGEYTDGLDMIVSNNTFVGGFTAVAVIKQAGPFTFTGNTVYTRPSSVKEIDLEPDTGTGQTIASYTWDHNSYYGLNNFLYLQNRTFTSWQSATGFDANSTFNPNAPTGAAISVRPNAYEAKRANIIVYNWDSSSAVNVDLSSVLAQNDAYVILDAQNFYGPPVAQGTYTGSTVSIPMMGLAKATPNGFPTPAHTAPLFGTFIVMPASSIPTPVSVTVTPPGTVLKQSETQQFTATIQNTSDHRVTWSISPAIGTITSNGFYTAPPVMTTGQTITVTAASVADPSQSGSVTLTLKPPIAVSVGPVNWILGPNQTKQFVATVTSTDNTAVTWSINPVVGGVASDGSYTAPSTISAAQTVTITATSVADPTKSGSTTVTIQPVAVTIAPASVTLFAGDTQQFTPTVTGVDNTAVIWTLNPPGIGTLSSTGLYTAPSPLSGASSVSVTATSVSDSSKSATASITLSPPISPAFVQPIPDVTALSGQAVTLSVQATGGGLSYQWESQPPGGSSFSPIPGATSSTYTTAPVTLVDSGTQFHCVITNSIGSATSNASNLIVILGVNYVGATTLGTLRNNFSGWVGANLTVGANQMTVTSLGRMFAPGNTGTHIVKLVTAGGVDVPGGSVAVPMLGGTPGTFMYNNLPSLVNLSPNTTYFLLSQEVSGGDQWYDQDTTVQTAGVATVIGPAYGTPYASFTGANRMYGPLDLRYSAYLSVSPAGTILYGGQSRQFTVTITGTSNNAVNWSVDPAVGSISSSGLYIAPATITSTQAVSVTATSVADPTRSATAIVTLDPPIAVLVSPSAVALTHDQTQQFTATVQNTPNPGVTWSIVPSVGSITTAGLYTAPSSISSPQSITVLAISLADGTTAGTATVNLTPPVPVILSPGTASLGTSQNQQFTVNQPVTWSLNPAVGSISSGGLYTAPATIPSGQTIVVTATSNADGTQHASSSITLVPPTPVSISQQPQNQTVIVGQPATFTVVAAGTQISYQWQSMPSGAGSFSPIAGATSSSYTLAAASLSDHGTQYRCVVTNSVSSATSSVATLAVLPAGSSYIQSVTMGSPRNDFSGWVGMKITVGDTPISVGALGRYYLSGNHGNHTVKIVDAANGTDVPGGSTTVNMALGTSPGTFVYAPLANNVTLTPNHSYYIAAIEGQFGDSWYDLNTHVQTSSVATVNGAVYGAPFVAASVGNSTYVPVDFLYIVPVTVTMSPAAIQLNVSQTQQFTTTIVGTGNTAVNWTLTPSIGSISPSGLYTAPGTISTTQTVTVTATSVADPTQSASSIVTLQPVAVSMTPAIVSLFATQTQQFNPTVTGTGNTGLTWTINPSGAGSISPAGLYTAPASIAVLQNVTVTATSVVDIAKSASGTVTLQPPPPPTLTSQPQNASVLTGQAAIFNVTATGALGYQWQSQAPGAGSFSNIAGATSSTYTTPPATAADDGTQFRCVVSNAAGSVNSNVVGMSVIAGANYVTSIPAVGSIRHDYNGWIGASINVGSAPLTVSALGRLFLAGNTQTHAMKVVTTAGTDVAGSTVSVNMAGGTPGAFVYGVLPTPITLNANSTYYILTQETSNGDLWYDYAGTTVQTTNVASTAGAAYGTGPYVAISSSNHMFVPVSFLYVSVASVAVSVNPATASLSESQTQQFTATVTGDPNTSVTWSLNPNAGSISSTGLYTAPSSIGSSQTITVTATSVADNTKSGSATVTLTPVSVSIAPATSSLGASQTQQFTPSVTGGSNTTVTWTINPNGAGSISGSGLYTAPASIASVQTVTVTATSAADNTKFGTAAVTLNPPAPPAITQQPLNTSVFTGQTAGFSVTATGPGLTYQWQSMASGAGSFTNISGATSSSYTTPVLALADSGTQFRVVVTNAQSSVTSSAATLTVLASGTSFVTASTPGSLRNDFTGWVGMKVTVGSQAIAVSSIGRMVVLNNLGTHTLKIVDATTGNDLAVTNVNTLGATAGTILYGALTGPVTLNANSSYYIVSHEAASGDQWYELNSLVQTTSDAIVNGPEYGIPFTLVGGMAGHSYVILDFKYSPAGPPAVSVSVTPTTASLNGGQTQQFSATVTGDPNTSVTWSLNPNVGSVSSTGLYTAPASVASSQSVTVTATSVADNTKSASATVTLVPVSVVLAPGTSSLTGGQTQQFTPTVSGTGNTSVTWSLNIGSVGSISASGLYSAPASIASSQTITVTATSVADNTKSASATVTLVQVAVSLSPATSSLSGGQTQQFTPTVTGTANTSVNWTINPSNVGSISSAGLYTAPALIGSPQTVTVTATSVADNTKLGTATITLNPPALPIITQQPQNATVNAGQTATFSVTATGALSYQWQSQAPGAGTFTLIPGATANSYTTPVTALADGGTQFRCVVANSQGSVTTNNATLTVTTAPPPNSKSFVLSTAFGSLRNDFTGWVGMSVTIGTSPLSVNQLGRIFAPGNGGSHTVKIVDATTGTDVAGGSVSISMSGGTSGNFVYGTLVTPVVLSSGGTYYILSQETAGADKWYDYNTTASTNWEAALSASVYGTGSSYAAIGNSAGHMYVPLDFKYASSISAFVSSFTLGTQRNNYTGWVGMGFTVGGSSLTVNALGRYVSAGDSASHTVKFVDAATGLDVAGGSATVVTAGATAGGFAYATLSSPVVLNANATYFIVSAETAGGDHWYDVDTTVQSAPAGTVGRAVYGSGSSFTIAQSVTGHAYVPLNFQFQ